MLKINIEIFSIIVTCMSSYTLLCYLGLMKYIGEANRSDTVP